MKRYLVFAGYKYYPAGGMDDFIDDYDDKNKAFSRAEKEVAGDYDWANVFDQELRDTVGDNWSIE